MSTTIKTTEDTARLAQITEIILEAKRQAYSETDHEPEPELTAAPEWPISCTIGPGLEGAIACETKIGYVNGSKGWLIYRGYDVFDLCAHSSYEETAFLLLHGHLPSAAELSKFKSAVYRSLFVPQTQRLLLSFPVEQMNPMSALRLGINLMRQKQTFRDQDTVTIDTEPLATDEDSIAMETTPRGERKSIFEFFKRLFRKPQTTSEELVSAVDIDSCYNLIGGVAAIAATIGRVRQGRIPIEPLPDLSLAGNYLYMLTGRRPTAVEERIMDICFILHADHGMNASTFASLVVASTLSDIYLAVGAGVSALAGPLHGGANVEVVKMLEEIGTAKAVDGWVKRAVENKQKIMGFGHRVYKAYDPRARILRPLARMLAEEHLETLPLFETAAKLETAVAEKLGAEKKVFPNVDFYSGIVYRSMNIPADLYTTIFAVSRV